MIFRHQKRGATLLVLVVVILIVAIVVLSTTVFIVEQHALVNTKSMRIKTIELAQAGINSGIYRYRATDYGASSQAQVLLQQENMDADHYFMLGAADADLLMVNTSNSSLDNKSIINFEFKNATSTRTIGVTQVIVRWDTNARLRFVEFNGEKTPAKKNKDSPATITLKNEFILDAVPTTYGGNVLIFSQSMAGSTVSLEFIMSGDATSKTVQIYPASNKFNFTLKSTGRTTFSNIQRTVSAQYNSLTGAIEDYHEINTHLIP